MNNILELQINPSGNLLLKALKADLEHFFSREACKAICSTEIFNSEADIQVRLVLHLKSLKKYDKVWVEYKVSKDIYETRLKQLGYKIPSPVYPWNNHIRIDIVVERDGEFAIIELKYATAFLKGQDLFGEDIDYNYLTNHDASNLIMYNYWKDVRRIEMSSLVFPNVVGGFAILVTNNDVYLKQPTAMAAYKEFSTYNGRTVGKVDDNMLLDWDESHKNLSKKIKEEHPEFIIEGYYNCEWRPTCMQSGVERNRNFDYLMLEVDKVPQTLYLPQKYFVGQNTTVQDIVKWFKEITDLELKVYKSGKILDEPELLTANGGKKGHLDFRSSITVKNLEKKFKDKLNLDVKVFTKDAWVHVLPDITIASASKIPAGATRKSMGNYVSYKRKK